MGDGTRNISAEVIAGSDRHMKHCLSQRTADSHLGGIAETYHVIDYCTARNIKADIELIHPEEINRDYERVVNKDCAIALSSTWLR